MGLSRGSSRIRSTGRRRLPAAGAGQRRGVHADPAARPVLRPGLASGRSPSHAPRRFAREEAGVFACGMCHRADGPGGPENSSLAGLPEAYIIQQMADFKSGARRTSVPERLPPQLMSSLSGAATDAEVESAAAYFSALKPRAVIRVVETDTVPRTHVAGWHLAAVDGGGREPIGRRIIEIPEDLERFVSRDARSRFVAYVPVGSLRKGRALAAGGGGRTVECGTCHGPDLTGPRADPWNRGALTELLRPPAVRLQARRSSGDGERPDEASRREAHRRRHALARGVRSLPAAVSPGPGRSPQTSRQRETRPSSSSAPISRQSASRSPRRAPRHSRSSRLSARGTSVRSVASRR